MIYEHNDEQISEEDFFKSFDKNTIISIKNTYESLEKQYHSIVEKETYNLVDDFKIDYDEKNNRKYIKFINYTKSNKLSLKKN